MKLMPSEKDRLKEAQEMEDFQTYSQIQRIIRKTALW